MALAPEDPRLAFLNSLDLPACRIEFSQAPIVLVCGGTVAPLKPSPDAPDPPVASLRDAITRHHTKFELFRPEQIQDWHGDAVFKDLVGFERALAGICTLIVIILESPGSMVELGAFSQLPELADKCIVICSNSFDDQTSFINLGILRFLSTKNNSRVKNYPWDIDRPLEIEEFIVEDVVADIGEELARLPKSASLRFDHDGHCVVMLVELLRLFTALKESELLEYLAVCGYKISNDELKERLFLLKSFNIVRTQKYSDAAFYMIGSEPFHKMRLASLDKAKTADSVRINAMCLELYAGDARHKNRHRAIAKSLTRGVT